MSTRTGKFVAMDTLLEDALKEATKTVSKKMPKYSKKLKEGIAKAYISTVYLECPYCGGDVCDSDGSLNIPWNSGDKLKCIECGREVKMPKKVSK